MTWLDYPTMQTMSIRQLLQSKRAKILQIAARHGARKVRIFGSVARGEARRGSDVDFLVDMSMNANILNAANATSMEYYADITVTTPGNLTAIVELLDPLLNN